MAQGLAQGDGLGQLQHGGRHQLVAGRAEALEDLADIGWAVGRENPERITGLVSQIASVQGDDEVPGFLGGAGLAEQAVLGDAGRERIIL